MRSAAGRIQRSLSHPFSATALPATVSDAPTAAPDKVDAGQAQAMDVAPIAASLAPMPASSAGTLLLRFRGESWVDISDAQGRSIERGMVVAGTEFSYPAGSVGRLVLGNASAVDVLQDGRVVELAPYSTENVARFEVSSEGRISAPGQ